MKNVERLSSGLRNHLSSLQFLYIDNCPELRDLPEDGLPPSLQQLKICGCQIPKDQYSSSMTRSLSSQLIAFGSDELQSTTPTRDERFPPLTAFFFLSCRISACTNMSPSLVIKQEYEEYRKTINGGGCMMHGVFCIPPANICFDEKYEEQRKAIEWASQQSPLS